MGLSLQVQEPLEERIKGAIAEAQAKSISSGRGVGLVPPSFHPLYSVFAGKIHTYWKEKEGETGITRWKKVDTSEYLDWLRNQPIGLREYALTALQSFLEVSDNKSMPILY